LLFAMLAVGCAAPPAAIALGGTIVTADAVIADGVVVVEGDRIRAVYDRPTTVPGAASIETGGIIAPGLIDLHNHVLWNALPRWSPHGAYASRDAWLAAPEYLTGIAGPQRALRRTHGCDLNRFGEVRAIVGGATSVQGSLEARCSAGLVRNLDHDPGLGGGDGADARHLATLLDVDSLSPNEAKRLAQQLRGGVVGPLLVHLGEGRPDSAGARDEFATLVRYDLLTDRTVIVHGTALGAGEFDAMQAAGAALVWSPRSNVELYGETTSIAMAIERGIPVALAPDWAITGSSNLLDELRYAFEWSRRTLGEPLAERELVAMATSMPALIAGIADRVGAIRPGLYADLLVIRGARADPYRTLVHARPPDVRLVMVGGEAVYGAADLVRQLRGRWDLEDVEICGSRMALDTTVDAASLLDYRYRLRATQARLREALASARPALALPPLAECRP
jgi:cytosine/adenosine deaminase-related metal-dependent hydrolase